MNQEEIKAYRAMAIFMLANEMHSDDVLNQMESLAKENHFDAAEGMRQGIYDWFSCKNSLNCKTYPSDYQPHVRVVQESYSEDEEDDEGDEWKRNL